MALKKNIVLGNGIPTEYHRVNYISVENNGEEIGISTLLQSFVNESYRDESLANVVSQATYAFNVERSIVEDNNIFEVVYGLIKTLDTFEDAEDA
jgi:hypothetical protein